MSKHTPGPWTYERKLPSAGDYHDKRAAIFANGDVVGVAYQSGDKDLNAQAHAKLFAAAPEMAEALRTLLNNVSAKLQGETDYARWHGISAVGIGEVLNAARAALAKAGL